jgi:hypothetical protein
MVSTLQPLPRRLSFDKHRKWLDFLTIPVYGARHLCRFNVALPMDVEAG